MKLSVKIKRLIEKNSFDSVLNCVMGQAPLDRILMACSNECVFKASKAKTKKASKAWYKMARVFHRAYDEMLLEKKKKVVFKISRRDIYLCPKCKKKFKVEPSTEENCKFELDRGMIVVKCPNCGHSE
jgi:DNA-directed RNA polymerase subunit RPC12/RpoP